MPAITDYSPVKIIESNTSPEKIFRMTLTNSQTLSVEGSPKPLVIDFVKPSKQHSPV